MDREKTIASLETTKNWLKGYGYDLECIDNAITLLKEQEPVEPEVEVLNEVDKLYRCHRCHKCFFYEHQKFCDHCGQAVKWE